MNHKDDFFRSPIARNLECKPSLMQTSALLCFGSGTMMSSSWTATYSLPSTNSPGVLAQSSSLSPKRGTKTISPSSLRTWFPGRLLRG